MIKTTSMLLQELQDYVNPAARIQRMTRGGSLIQVVRGIYETDSSVSGYCLAGVIYGPSYLSFEYALAKHDLIPEAVYAFTSATCGKGRKKRYETPFGIYTYRDVPAGAFPYGTELREENGYGYILASPEKAVCDMLYTCSPRGNRDELKQLLFEDLRIDEQVFSALNRTDMAELAGLYRTANHRLLISLLKEMTRHEQRH